MGGRYGSRSTKRHRNGRWKRGFQPRRSPSFPSPRLILDRAGSAPQFCTLQSAFLSVITVESLHIYPLKSARGTAVHRLDLDARGPRGDRRWMLVDHTGRFLSLREVPRLAFVTADLTDTGLRISVRDGRSVDVAIPEQGSGAQWIEGQVWSDRCRVVLADDAAALWLSAFLAVPCRLAYLPDDADGPRADKYGAFGGQPRQTALTDGAPVLLTSTDSLADLNHSQAPLPDAGFAPMWW